MVLLYQQINPIEEKREQFIPNFMIIFRGGGAFLVTLQWVPLMISGKPDKAL